MQYWNKRQFEYLLLEITKLFETTNILNGKLLDYKNNGKILTPISVTLNFKNIKDFLSETHILTDEIVFRQIIDIILEFCETRIDKHSIE